MYKKRIQLSMMLLAMGFIGLFAQEAIVTSGNTASGNGGTVSYTVGQTFGNTYTTASGTVSQGVQQPFEIMVVTEIAEVKNMLIECKAYPNPTTDFFVVKVDFTALQLLGTNSNSKQNIIGTLYDTNGKVVKSSNIESDETLFDMQNNPSTSYFLKISIGNKDLKTFKIIKK